MKKKALFVNVEGYVFLQTEASKQRGREPSERQIERLKQNFERFGFEGKYELRDGDLGGGCGSRNPSTWTSWSVDDMSRMLEKQKIAFEIGTCERTEIAL